MKKGSFEFDASGELLSNLSSEAEEEDTEFCTSVFKVVIGREPISDSASNS